VALLAESQMSGAIIGEQMQAAGTMGGGMVRTKTASIGIRIDPELKARVDAICAAEFRSVAGLVEMLLTQYVASKGDTGPPGGMGTEKRKKGRKG
jgi:hypothetical protein